MIDVGMTMPTMVIVIRMFLEGQSDDNTTAVVNTDVAISISNVGVKNTVRGIGRK